MSPEQKQSWGIVVAFAFALAVVLILIPLVGLKFAWLALGLYGLGGFGALLFGKKRAADKVSTDERDKTIAKTATLGAAMISCNTFLLICMVIWSVYRHQGKEEISIDTLPLIVFGGMSVFWLVRAIAILVLYGREPKDGQD